MNRHNQSGRYRSSLEVVTPNAYLAKLQAMTLPTGYFSTDVPAAEFSPSLYHPGDAVNGDLWQPVSRFLPHDCWLARLLGAHSIATSSSAAIYVLHAYRPDDTCK